MPNRYAFFIDKETIEDYFGFATSKDSLFAKHYNLAPGYQLPVIRKIDDEISLKQIQLGPDKNSASSAAIGKDTAAQILHNNKTVEPVILPLSGFYIWKGGNEQGQPFFVRMLNNAIMPIAALLHRDKAYVQVVLVPANTLIQPMSEQMPLYLNKIYSEHWLNSPEDPEAFFKQSQGLFTITDLSVLKVSKKVNDLTQNNPSLIQPEPK
jgi:putative SOS response-associated peptidase YedK